MKNVYFVSGIDTGCGKTYITGQLAKRLSALGKKVVTHKIIQTGCKGLSEDILEHRRLMNISLLSEDHEGLTCPYIFSFPASPHYAAQLEDKKVDLRRVAYSLKKLSNFYEFVLCEGAGGIMVPLTEDVKTVDFVKQHHLPLILVISSRLGGLNHAMLTFEFCFTQKINLKCVIFNQFPEDDKGMAKDMYDYLEKYLQKKGKKKSLLYPDVASVDLLSFISDSFMKKP
jgi:dethiobiotin synthetase